MRRDLVPEEVRSGNGHHSQRLKPRRSRHATPGSSYSQPNWLRLGHAYLRLFHASTAGCDQLDRSLSFETESLEFGLDNILQNFCDIHLVLTVLGSFFYSMGMLIPITYIELYGEYVGMRTSLAGYLVSIFNAAR